LFEALFKYPRDDFARSELVYAGDWPLWLLILLVGGALAGISWLLYRRRRFVAAPQMLVVWLLQAAMLAVVIWILLQPALSIEQLRPGENAVALVLDQSQSMAYGNAESRLQQAMRSLNSPLADDQALNMSVQHYELSERARPVDNFLGATPTGTSTSIAASLTDVLREARFSPLAAIVFSSDGADTSGGLSPADLAEIAGFGVSVHTIGVGREIMPEDIELTDVTLPDKALPGSTITARVSIRHDAPGSTRIKVYNGDDLLESLPVELRPDTTITTALVDIELAEAGHHQLRFSVDGIAGERELRNNSRSTLVTVADQSYRILYYEGEPRWEYKFMRRALADEEDIKIATLLRVSPNKYYRQGIDSAEQLENGFPATRDELFAYDALIIGSVEAASLSNEQQEVIHAFVSKRGGSLMMLAGPNGLGNGGWGQSKIASVLPARLPPSTTKTFFRKKATAVLTPQGAGDQVLRIADSAEANRDAWNEMPQIADYQVTGSLRPAAVTLLNAQTDVGEIPLLMTQQYGRGHAWILASGGTWRWQMSMPVEDLSHETFWRQLLRALVASAPNSVSLQASGDAGSTGVSLRAEFRDDAFLPVDDIGVTVVVTHQDGDTWSVNLTPSAAEPGVFRAEVSPTASGTWYFEALAERNGEPIDTARTSIHYESGQAEYFGFRRDTRTLQRLSEVTGGRFLEIDELGALPDLLRYSSSGITETVYRPIWDAPAVFLLLLLLKGSEWLLRRRWSTI